MNPDRIRRKAAALRAAWRNLYGSDMPAQAQVLALSVAIHETNAGDSWKGPDGLLDTADDEHNWGATTLRALNGDERAAVAAAGIHPSVGPGHAELAKAAQAAIVAAGLPLPQGAIHCDSSPRIGPYFVWFATFPDDTAGAEYFLKLLCGLKSPRPARAVLLRSNGTEQELAAAMYSAGYYTGFHDPRQPGGAQANIDAYAGSLRAISPSVQSALSRDPATEDTDPGITPRNDVPAVLSRTLRRGDHGPDVAALQAKLGVTADSHFGIITETALRNFQASVGLQSDGICGPLSRKALGL